MAVLRDRLREIRGRRGWQKRAAELAGVTPETLTRWKNGTGGNPTLSQLEGLAAALGVSLGYLISRKIEEAPTLPAEIERDHAAAQLGREAERLAERARDLATAARSQRRR